jgi:zinc protease
MSLALLSTATAQSGNRIERIVTPGGIEIWHVRDNSLPMLSLEFSFRGGTAQDPMNKPGVAYIATALLDEGAGNLDARAFQEQLEERAISLSFSSDRDALRGSLKTLTENRDKAFELLQLALTAPRFDAAEVERIKAQTLAMLRRRSTNPSNIAGERWFAKAFPNHPYGLPQQGTVESVPAITVADLRGHFDNVVARSHLKLASVGAISGQELAALVDRAFGKLPAQAKLKAVPEVLPQALGERDIYDLDVPQTVITIGGIGIKRSDPDFISAFVLNHILGGGTFSSRLYREVREKRGLAYSVYSYLAPYAHTGLFMSGVSTRNDRAAETLAIILEETRRLATEGPSADELAKAKSYLIGSFPLRFDTSGKVAGQLLEIQMENLGIDYIDRRNSLVEAVTLADVQRAAARFLKDARLLVTLVGRPKPAPVPGDKG